VIAHAVPPDRPSRWALVATLIERWFGPASVCEPAGVAERELDAAERRLGVALPEALREWYRGFGARDDVWNVQDRLLSPRELDFTGDLLIVCRENQDVVEWGIERAALGAADPPVVLVDPGRPSDRHVEAAQVSLFTLQMLALNAKFSRRRLFGANGPLTDEAARALEGRWGRLPFAELRWPLETHFHGDEHVLVELEANAWVWITARDEAAFDLAVRIAEDAGVQWADLDRAGG
jgi:hypothetical protein